MSHQPERASVPFLQKPWASAQWLIPKWDTYFFERCLGEETRVRSLAEKRSQVFLLSHPSP